MRAIADSASKVLGQPDVVVESTPYTMPGHHQDVWWRPTSEIKIDEPRWVKAVEIRPSHVEGRKITHHAIAYLMQEETDNLPPGTDPALNARAYLMEWAIGKGYDQFRDGTGKLLDTATIYPHEPRRDWQGALSTLARMVVQHGVSLLSIGNGTGFVIAQHATEEH